MPRGEVDGKEDRVEGESLDERERGVHAVRREAEETRLSGGACGHERFERAGRTEYLRDVFFFVTA